MKSEIRVSACAKINIGLQVLEYKSKYGKLCYDFDFVDTPKTETTETTEKQADIF